MKLRLQIANETGNKIPYGVDLQTIGYFDLTSDISAEEREDIAKVNGASLLYGVLREVLFSLTARFPRGPLVLPSVNFFDLKKSARKQPGVEKESRVAAKTASK